VSKILIFIAKIIGRVWVFACVPFRAYARSVVYSYVLQNDLPLKRLYERSPMLVDGKAWMLQDIHGVGRLGHVNKRKVNKIQFYLVVIFIWGWLDDDSNEDTTDKGYIETLVKGQRKIKPYTITDFILSRNIDKLAKIDFSQVTYGNAFDLGDVRGERPFYNFWATLAWNNRNTAMNFQYLWMDY